MCTEGALSLCSHATIPGAARDVLDTITENVERTGRRYPRVAKLFPCRCYTRGGLRRLCWNLVCWCCAAHKRDTMALLAWLWMILPVVEMMFGNRPSQSSNNVPLWTLGTVQREILQSRGHTGCRWGSMRVSNLEMRPSWNDTPCDQCWEPLVTWPTRAGPTCQGQFQSYRAVSTAHMCWTSKRKTAR